MVELPLHAISIRQPWAWLIVRPDLTGPARQSALSSGIIKTIENRTWPTRFRGPILIHAAAGMTRDEYEEAQNPLFWFDGPDIQLPPFAELERGGVVGRASLVSCVAPGKSVSWWHMPNQYGFELADIEPIEFIPMKGALKIFRPDCAGLRALGGPAVLPHSP